MRHDDSQQGEDADVANAREPRLKWTSNEGVQFEPPTRDAEQYTNVSRGGDIKISRRHRGDSEISRRHRDIAETSRYCGDIAETPRFRDDIEAQAEQLPRRVSQD